MKNLFKAIILLAIISHGSISFGASNDELKYEHNYFQFVIPKYHTTRQSGQTVDIYVRYAYKKNLSPSDYPDYRKLRANVLKYMEPSGKFPENIFWEIIASNMGRELIKDFPLEGVSIQLIVHDNQTPKSYEPGAHGPIFTLGNILPLAVAHQE